ncbi:hypothetical protein [Dyella sp.]|uniref:hypothetical protein n=1 Tax=Dyella sp. TaxID=1869338 RepID=UPI003F809C53
MDFRINLAGLAVVALASFGLSTTAHALPDCNTCVPAYQACVASGATDCDTRYAVCLRYCPAFVSAIPFGKPTRFPVKNPFQGKQEGTRLIAAVSPR